MSINKPKFVCIGAPKSGTTSLYHYLSQHPGIFLPKKKELHFFSRKQIADRIMGPKDAYALDGCPKSDCEYLDLFSSLKEGQIGGDISPSYFSNNLCFEDMKAFLGTPKIIIILRNPVDKAYSQYMHLVREGRETLSFEDAIDAEDERVAQRYSDFWQYRSSGLYSNIVSRAISIFGKHNVGVFFQEELRSSPQKTLRKICEFIEVEDIRFSVTTEYNKSGVPKSMYLSKLFSPGPFLRFSKLLIPYSVGVAIKNFIMELNTGKKITLSNQTRASLANYYAKDVASLNSFINVPEAWSDFSLNPEEGDHS